MVRFRAGLSAGPHLAGTQGCVSRGSPSSERLRICAFRHAYSSLRCEAAAQAAYRRMMRLRAGLPAGPPSLECEAAYHAARQAQGGLGSAFRPAYSALRCEAAAQAAYRRMMRLRAGLPAGPHLAERGAACHAARQARSGLGSAFRPAYSALRSKAAARAAQCLPVSGRS